MADSPPNAPKKYFKRDSIGYVTAPIYVDIERGRIRFFSSVIGERGGIHHDLETARAAGYPDLVAPPTFVTTLLMDSTAQLAEQKKPSVMDLMGCNFKRLLHGVESYEYRAPIIAGETLKVMTEVTGFEDTKSGKLEIGKAKTSIESDQRGLLITVSTTLLHRLG